MKHGGLARAIGTDKAEGLALPYLGIPWLVPSVILACLALMAVLLGMIRMVKTAFGAPP